MRYWRKTCRWIIGDNGDGDIGLILDVMSIGAEIGHNDIS